MSDGNAVDDDDQYLSVLRTLLPLSPCCVSFSRPRIETFFSCPAMENKKHSRKRAAQHLLFFPSTRFPFADP